MSEFIVIFSYYCKFGMGEYFKYGGSLNAEQRGLAIEGLEYAWLSDVVRAFLMENMKTLFSETSFSNYRRSKICRTTTRVAY